MGGIVDKIRGDEDELVGAALKQLHILPDVGQVVADAVYHQIPLHPFTAHHRRHRLEISTIGDQRPDPLRQSPTAAREGPYLVTPPQRRPRHCSTDMPTAAERAKLAQALDDFLDEQVTPKLGGLPLPGTLIGAGGTPVFLARIFLERDDLSADEIESVRLTLPEVQLLTERLWKMPMAARRELAGLPANRADVILFGAAIYEAVMMRCGFGELRPTLRGVRYGALLD
mgnify:CR=1 FL=1